jgi:hypothetical protein
MTISAELQARYTSEHDVDWAEAFVLSHPNATTRYLINHAQQHIGYVDNVPQLFEPVPAQITPPGRDDSGRSEMSIAWCGVHDEALTFLNQAIANGLVPITCRYSVYIIGDPTPQIDPWITFNLTNIGVQEGLVAATATRSDILNRAFPSEVYRVDKFPGLRRR